MTPAQIDAVIAGLTRAQREAVLAGWGSYGIARALKRKGLSSGSLGSDPQWCAIVETEDGLAVRQRLVEMGEGA